MPTSLKKISTKTELFQNYINKYKEEAKKESSDNYYHTNIVAEAYNQGFKDGKKKSGIDYMNNIYKVEVEKFVLKSNQIYILSKKLISYITDENFEVSSLHINITHNRPSVIISIPNKLLINDDFVEKSYTQMFEIRKIYSKLYNEMLDIGFVGSDTLDFKLLSENGFGYEEKYG